MKYKYRIIILDINKGNLHEELNKHGASGYKIIDIRDLPPMTYSKPEDLLKSGGLKREYTLMKEYKDRKHLKN